jgi:hypothetical protein
MVVDVAALLDFLLGLLEFSYKVITKSILFATSASAQYRRARFGVAGDILYFMRLVDTDALQEMHWNINLWTDKEVLAWRDSYLATYNAVSVAGAIFASIGLTALQLPDMYTVHWSARALCVASMILGVISVTMATSQQYALSTLKNPTSIRLWLSRGRPTAYEFKGVFGHRVIPTSIHELRHFLDRTRNQEQRRHHPELSTSWRKQDKYKDDELLNGLPLESSVSVLKAVAMPRHLLDVAVLVFIIGFGLYLLFQWVENMGGQPIANRNVFVVFVISVGTFVLYYVYIVSFMVDNQAKKAKEFDLLDLGGPYKPTALEELERDLEETQRRLKTLEEQRRAIESQIQGIVRTSDETGTRNGDAPEIA